MLGVARRAVGALGTAAGRAGRAQAPQVWQSVPAACQLEARRGYRQWWRVLPEDFELNTESMPKDVKSLMASNPYNLGFIDAYWYWRIRAESTIMDPENLPKKSYKHLHHSLGPLEPSKTLCWSPPSTLSVLLDALAAPVTMSMSLFGSAAVRVSCTVVVSVTRSSCW